MTKYDTIGTGYNQTRQADDYLTSRLIALLDPNQNDQYLEIGCGTGNYTSQLEGKGFTCVGVDPSDKMLNTARKVHPNMAWYQGKAEKTGFADDTFNGVFGVLTIHHWTDLRKGFNEAYKILKPDGKLVIFTSTPEQMKGYWLNHYFPQMMTDSIKQMPSRKKLSKALTNVGFDIVKYEMYSVKPTLQDKFLYCGKNDSKLYLDKTIRNGISSFSSLANSAEVKSGLLELKNDIDSGRIVNIMESYGNTLGDYMFIVAEKKGN